MIIFDELEAVGGSILDQVVADHWFAAERRRVELLVTAPDTLAFGGDPRLLRSAISNILGNVGDRLAAAVTCPASL